MSCAIFFGHAVWYAVNEEIFKRNVLFLLTGKRMLCAVLVGSAAGISLQSNE